MARRAFFSFHFERDIWRTGQVRNAWLTHPDRKSSGYWDASIWEKAKIEGDNAIKSLIQRGLNGTSVTVVLIGRETSTRRWVKYEIQQSAIQGNGLVGIYIHNLKDTNGKKDFQGTNPLDQLSFNNGAKYSSVYPSYDWVNDNGYKNIGIWIEKAAKIAGR